MKNALKKDDGRAEHVAPVEMRELSLDELEFVGGAKDRRNADEGRTTGWDVRFLDWLLRRR